MWIVVVKHSLIQSDQHLRTTVNCDLSKILHNGCILQRNIKTNIHNIAYCRHKNKKTSE